MSKKNKEITEERFKEFFKELVENVGVSDIPESEKNVLSGINHFSNEKIIKALENYAENEKYEIEKMTAPVLATRWLRLGEAQRKQAMHAMREQNENLYALAKQYMENMGTIFQQGELRKQQTTLQYYKKEWERLKNNKEYIVDEEKALEAVKENGYALKHVRNQTEEICLEAVKENGHALVYVRNQTEKICLKAVEQDGHALKYVHNQTEKICLAAIEQNKDALQYVDAKFF